jgi:hypothetical protein
MKVFSFLIFLLVFSVSAADLTKIFNVGSGQIYKMTSDGYPTSTVTIYYTNVKKEKLWVEFFIESGEGLLKTGLWQQFAFESKDAKNMNLVAGYIKDYSMPVAEKLPQENLKGSDSLKMSQFLFQDPEKIKKHFIKKEEVSVPAGTVNTSKYKIVGNDQTIEFWLAEDSTPLVMVKLISTGKKKVNNYQMELITLAANVKAKIDPNNARELSEKMRKVLESTPVN